ncbi:MAG: ABC transporter substrate-binding protein [Bacillota bacterium]|nr:ABC transporter substrate-binding protein [Bacillota bacterium]
MTRKWIAWLLIVLMAVGLTSCGGGGDPNQTTAGGNVETTGPAGTPTAKVYKTYMSSDCASLNFLDNVDSNAETPSTYCTSFLWRTYPNEDGTNYVFINDLAAEEPIQIDDNNWKIVLRQDAKFHNGDPINADTWIFTFQQQLNPKMAARMGTFLYDSRITIVNGENYYKQGSEGFPATVAWDEVGIKKLDDYTIQITTEDKHSAQDIMKHFYTRNLSPINRKMWDQCLSADGLTTSYGSDLEHFVGSGPYHFKDWQYDSLHVYEKNPDHWISNLYHFDRVEVRIVPEMNARVELFEKGEIMSLEPDANTIDTYLDDPRMTTFGNVTVTHIDINCKNPDNPITANLNYRRAIYHAIDRETVANTIFGHMAPAGTYVNDQAGMFSENALTYRESKHGLAVTEMVNQWGPAGYSPKLALEYLNKALKEENVPEGTVITLKYVINDSDKEWKALGEYLMEEWQTIFEGKVKLEIVPYAGMSATDFKKTGDDKWDLSPNDWARSLSRTYPHTCFYYYTTKYEGGPNNFHVAEFDEQYEKCESIKNGDYDTLLAETKKLEEIYLNYVIQCPVYQQIKYQLFSENLKLPVKNYIPGFGWGIQYGDIAN